VCADAAGHSVRVPGVTNANGAKPAERQVKPLQRTQTLRDQFQGAAAIKPHIVSRCQKSSMRGQSS